MAAWKIPYWYLSNPQANSDRKKASRTFFSRGLTFALGGHLKTGHRGSPQNRPTGRGQDMRLLYRVGGRRGKSFFCFEWPSLGIPAILASPGRRIVATQGCDPSADPGAGMAGRRPAAPAASHSGVKAINPRGLGTESPSKSIKGFSFLSSLPRPRPIPAVTAHHQQPRPPFWCASFAGRT